MAKVMNSGHKMIYIEGKNGKPGGYKYEHVNMMEKKIGRKLRPNEEVHHLNGNPADNRLDNLKLVTRGQHNTIDKELHNGGRPKGSKNK